MTMAGTSVTRLDGGSGILAARDLDALRGAVGGHVLLPRDAGWQDTISIWNAMAASVPALVVQPNSALEVAQVLRFARRHDLLVTIKGGGHNIAGTSLADGALTLDLSRMREVDVDPVARLARVGAGCRLADVDRATQEHGLATVVGFISETGVAGLTLGGGLGYLTRRFGWTVDNLEAVEIVTADGEICVADREQNSDLFWAIRGAGANFGVVTRFTFRLHDVGPTVFGGLIAWPFDRADEILAAYREITAQAPLELTVFLVLMNAPPAPFVPPEWHGQRVCAMAVCYTGELRDATAALAPVRALGGPVFDLLGERPYVEVQSYLDDSEPPGNHYYWKTEFLNQLDDPLLAALRRAFADCPVPGADIGVLHLGGTLHTRSDDDGAIGNRDAHFAVGVKAMWPPEDPNKDRHRAWVQAAWRQIRPFSAGRTYINFQSNDEGAERVQATYGRNYERLVELKSRYDADNLFRVNRNIPPYVTGTARRSG